MAEIANYTYDELFVPGKWYSEAEKSRREALVNTPKPLDPALTDISNPRPYSEDPQATALVQQEETIQAIVDALPEPPVPYDEVNPWAFDEALARASAEQEYIPYYNEMLEDYLEEQSVARTRGKEDLDRMKEYTEEDLDTYMETSGIRKQRELEDFEEYGETIAERRARLAEEKERGLEEYRIAQERSSAERDAYFQEARILEGRISEDERLALEEQGTDVDRISKLREEYEAKQERAQDRLREDLSEGLEGFDISAGRVDEDLLRRLESLTAGKESYLSREERAWKEAVKQTQEGYSGRNLFFSGLRGDTLKKMGVDRESIMEDYMRGYKEETELAEITSGRALEDISRARERMGVEYTRGEEDIQKAIEEYGLKSGWAEEDIARAVEQISLGAERRREDVTMAGEEYERKYGYTGEDIERQRSRMLAQAGYQESDLARQLAQYETGYGRVGEDIARGEELASAGAARDISERELMHQRFVEDLARKEALTSRDIAREQEAAVLGGVVQRKGEYGEEYEGGRQKYYEAASYPNAVSMLDYYK